jgi:hypothetical protein
MNLPSKGFHISRNLAGNITDERELQTLATWSSFHFIMFKVRIRGLFCPHYDAIG